MRKIFYIIFLSTIVGCATLSDKGKLVHYATKSEAPKVCQLLGEITIGEDLGRINVSQLKIEMRNAVGEMGGNFLVIDTIHYSLFDDFAGTGRAYKCPQ